MFIKIILTGIITLFIIFVLIHSDNPAGYLLRRAGAEIENYISLPFTIQVNRTLSFSFNLDRFPENMTMRAHDVNITLTGNIVLNVNNGNMSVNNIQIYNYNGLFSIDDKLTLDGVFQKIRTPDTVVITDNGKVDGHTTFTELNVSGLEILKIHEKTSGWIKIKGVTLFVKNEEIEFTEPKGFFSFGDSFYGSGMCENARIGNLVKE